MARIDRMAQRRQLRRAAEQALITAFQQPSESAPTLDISAPTARTNGNVDAHLNREPSIDDQRDEDPHDHWHDPDGTPPLGIPMPAAGEIYTTPIDSDASELSGLPSRRWYSPKRATIGLIAAAALAIAVTGVLLVGRHDDAAPGESTTDAPIASTSAPAPTSAAPAPSIAVVPPAPPLPPPPSSVAPPTPAPPITQPYTPSDETAPTKPDMPEIDVTRTPVTRAPMSVSPSPFPPPQYNQGDGRRAPRCCGF